MNRQEIVAHLQALYRRPYSLWTKFAFFVAVLLITFGIAKSDTGLIFAGLVVAGASARTFIKESD